MIIMVDNYIRVKKGMVFWYDIKPDRNKLSNPKIIVRESEFTDYAEYGLRPWIVVSSNEFNANNTYCSIIPLSTGMRQASDFELKIQLFGKPSTAICSQIRFVNGVQLKDYMATLNYDIMDQIDSKIANYIGIKSKTKKIEEPKVVVTPPAVRYVPVEKNAWIYSSVEYLTCDMHMKRAISTMLERSDDRLERISVADLIGRLSIGLNNKPVCKFIFTHMFAELFRKYFNNSFIEYGMKANMIGINSYTWIKKCSVIPTAEAAQEALINNIDRSPIDNNNDKIRKTVKRKALKRFKWTSELSHQVLNDHENLSREAFIDKYQLTNKVQYFNLKSRAITYLKIHESDTVVKEGGDKIDIH